VTSQRERTQTQLQNQGDKMRLRDQEIKITKEKAIEINQSLDRSEQGESKLHES
jgi:hypothetical protein